MKIIARRSILSPLQSVIGVVNAGRRCRSRERAAVAKVDGCGDRTDLEVELSPHPSGRPAQRRHHVPGASCSTSAGLAGRAEITLTWTATACPCAPARAALRSRPCRRRSSRQSTKSTPSRRSGAAEGFPRLLEKTHFSMAQQDVRYYLNGLLLETSAKSLRSVATTSSSGFMRCRPAGRRQAGQQVIVPRKACSSCSGSWARGPDSRGRDRQQSCSRTDRDIRFTSKLIDGRFPEYSRVIPPIRRASSVPFGTICDTHCSALPSCRTKSTGHPLRREAHCSHPVATTGAEEAEEEVEWCTPGGHRDRLQRELPPRPLLRGRHRGRGRLTDATAAA